MSANVVGKEEDRKDSGNDHKDIPECSACGGIQNRRITMGCHIKDIFRCSAHCLLFGDRLGQFIGKPCQKTEVQLKIIACQKRTIDLGFII